MSQGTGIEVTTHYLHKDSALVRVFGALHLTKLVAMLLHAHTLEIVVDGERHLEKDPLAPHFFACGPGEHDVKITLLGWGGASVGARTYNEAVGKVTVEPGKVTLVHYNFKSQVMLPDGDNTEIVTAGSREL